MSHVYSLLECTTSTYLSMHTNCKLHSFVHTNKYAYNHTPVLSSIRQGTLHGTRSKNFQMGRHKQHALGTLNKAVSQRQTQKHIYKSNQT